MKQTAKEKSALRDQIALQVTCICMADTSRQLSSGLMPIVDAPKAVRVIAAIAYEMADALLAERDRK